MASPVYSVRMSGPSAIPMTIFQEDAVEFERVIADTLESLNRGQLQGLRLRSPLYCHHGVQISFNRHGMPFLGHTTGFNNDNKPPRVFVRGGSRVLRITGNWLRASGANTGGRVFISEGGVVRDRQQLGRWEWHGDHPQDRIETIYASLVDQIRNDAAEQTNGAEAPFRFTARGSYVTVSPTP